VPLKLLNPQPRVDRVLDMVGITRFQEVYTDVEAAVASFWINHCALRVCSCRGCSGRALGERSGVRRR
jgi:hypothetical protein